MVAILALSSTSSFIMHVEDDGKVFCSFRGRNNNRQYVMIIEFFGFGRRSIVVVLEGCAGAG